MTAETLPKIDSNGALKTRRVIPVRSKRSALRASEDRAAYLFLAPWFAGLAGITLLPMLASLYLSFTDYKVLSAPHWVGMENYFQLFSDRRFIKSIWVTLTYVGWSVPLILIFSLTIATFLNRGLAGLAIYRTLFYIPSLIGASVGIGLLWKQVFGERGVFNQLLGAVRHRRQRLDNQSHLGVAFGDWAPCLDLWGIDGHLPRRAAPDTGIVLRSGCDRWRELLAALSPYYSAAADAGDLLQHGAADDRIVPVLHAGLRRSRTARGGPVDSTLLYSLYLYLAGLPATATWAMPRRWRGCCWSALPLSPHYSSGPRAIGYFMATTDRRYDPEALAVRRRRRRGQACSSAPACTPCSLSCSSSCSIR